MFGGADAVERAVADIAAGRAIVVVDDEDRENEGDLVFAAGAATPALVAFTVRHTSGYLCVALPGEECDRLGLPLMCPTDGDGFGTAFTVTVDAAHGVSTGISAADRAHTLRTLADARTTAEDLVRPGHVPPLRARSGGVLCRAGHAEAAVDLAWLAGVRPVAALCEIVSVHRPGEMARRDELIGFAAEHDLAVVTIADLATHRRRTEPQVVRAAAARLPTRAGEFVAFGFRALADGAEHLALVAAREGSGPAGPTPVAVHVECIGGDVLRSRDCSCGDELDAALYAAAADGRGVVIYLRTAGTTGCPSAPAADSWSAGPSPHLLAAHILADLGVGPVRLLGEHKEAVDLEVALEDRGITVVAPGTDSIRDLTAGRRREGIADVRPAVAAATEASA